ncbi:MAG: GldG family protein [bacterium]
MNYKFTKFQQEASFGTTVALVLAIAIVLNFISYQLFVRYDLTKNKDYSISQASKQTIGNLDDVVNIKAYFSQNAPAQYSQLRQEVGDLLDEYQNYSKGNIRYEMIDPTKDDELKMQLRSLGIPEVQFNVMEKDKYQVVNGYMGIVITYGDKNEVLPVVQDTNNFEYQLTSKIIKLTSKVQPVLGIVTSNKTLSAESEIKNAIESLRGLYEIQDIDLSKSKVIDDKIKTLLILGPREKFFDSQLKQVDAFIVKGGSAIFMVDGVKVEGGLQASVNDTGLNKLLEKYGIKINSNLVLDSSAGIASFNQGFMTFNLQYPFWPKITKTGFAASNPAVSKLESVTLPWASSIDINKEVVSKTTAITELIKSSPKSWTQTDSFNLNPQQEFTPTDSKSYLLGVMLKGDIKSAYTKEIGKNSRVVVISDSDFLRDNFMQGQSDSMNLFANLVDSLSLDESLMSIRAKGVTSRPIKADLTDADKNTTRYGNVFGITLLVMAFGVYRYTSRRKKREN